MISSRLIKHYLAVIVVLGYVSDSAADELDALFNLDLEKSNGSVRLEREVADTRRAMRSRNEKLELKDWGGNQENNTGSSLPSEKILTERYVKRHDVVHSCSFRCDQGVLSSSYVYANIDIPASNRDDALDIVEDINFCSYMGYSVDRGWLFGAVVGRYATNPMIMNQLSCTATSRSAERISYSYRTYTPEPVQTSSTGRSTGPEQSFTCRITCRTSGFLMYDTKDIGQATFMAVPGFETNRMTERCRSAFGGQWYHSSHSCR